MPGGFPDYIINDIPLSVAVELLALLHGQFRSRQLAEWMENLAGEVDLAVAQELLDFE